MKSKEEIEQLLIDVYGSSISIIGKELFVKGYTQCQEDNKPFFTEDTWNTMCSRIDELQSELSKKKYTEEDLRKAFKYGIEMEAGIESFDYKNYPDGFSQFINLLNKQDK
jgi:hypothetical protein